MPKDLRLYVPKTEEFSRWNFNQMLARYGRAFRERGMEGAVFWVRQNWQGQLENLGRLRQELAYQGFVLADPIARAVEIEGEAALWLRRAGAALLSCFAPLAVFLFFRRRATLAFSLSAVLGILVWFILGTDAFRLQLEPLGFIQVSFLFPFLVLFAWKRPSLPALALAGFLAVFSLLRSAEVLPVPSLEYAFRDFLDIHFGFRPRFKEIAGWFFWFQGGSFWNLPAMLAPVSTLNSFLHAHTPWPYIAARSCAAFLIAATLARLQERLTVSSGKIVLAGYFGCGNFGDDWILESKIRELNLRKGIPMNRISLWRRCLPLWEGRPDKVLFLGGLLQDSTSLKSFLYYWIVACVAALWAKEGVVFCSAGLGPLSPFSKRLMAWTLRSPLGGWFSFELRDWDSFRLLRALAPKAQGRLVADSAFSQPVTDRKPLRAGCAVLIHGGLEGSERWVGDCLSAFSSGKAVTLFLCDPDEDQALAQSLLRRFPGRISSVRYQGDTASFLALLEEHEACLSFRLHGTIAALRLGLPVLCAQGAGLEAFQVKAWSLVIPEGFPQPTWVRSPREAAVKLSILSARYGNPAFGMVSLI